jgi:AraC-like DNA-binding protein
MYKGELDRNRIGPSALTASAVAAFFVDQFDEDSQRVALPRPEMQIIVRFGSSARGGLDVHALSLQQKIRRKFIRGGQRTVAACLHLGASRAVFGVPASEIAGRILTLDELWGDAAVQRLLDRLACVSDTIEAVAVMESAIAERLAIAGARDARTPLVLEAAEKLVSTTVGTVALDLGVSERHLRRVFRETVGMSPKAFARLTRFRRALRAGQDDSRLSWATIAAATGYYDQAHLIEEFRAIAGVTPRALLTELDMAQAGTFEASAAQSNPVPAAPRNAFQLSR